MHKTVILLPQMGGVWCQVKNTCIEETENQKMSAGEASYLQQILLW
jgi:hypothetical protein